MLTLVLAGILLVVLGLALALVRSRSQEPAAALGHATCGPHGRPQCPASRTSRRPIVRRIRLVNARGQGVG